MNLEQRKQQNWELRRENLYKQLHGQQILQNITDILELETWPRGRATEYNVKLKGWFKLLDKLLPNARDKSEAITVTKEIVTDESGKQSEHVRVSRSVELLAEFDGSRTTILSQADGEDRSILSAEVSAQQT